MSPIKSGSKPIARKSTNATSRTGSNSGRGKKTAYTQDKSQAKSTSRSVYSKGNTSASRGSHESNSNRSYSQSPDRSYSGRSNSQYPGSQYGDGRQETSQYRNYDQDRGYGNYSDNRYDSNRYDDRGNRDQGNQYQQYGPDARYKNYDYNQGYRSQRQQGSRSSTQQYSQHQQQPYNQSYPSGKSEEGLRKLLIAQLKDLYWAEKALTKALPKLINKVSSEELIDAIEEHHSVTQGHVSKLEEVFQILGIKASAKKCEAMQGLIEEVEEITRELEEGPVRDAGIICAAQKVEHYEIATYGSLATYAQILDEHEAADLLHDILEEEKEADVRLTEIAGTINWDAKEEEDDEDEEDDDDDDDEMSTIESTNASSKISSKSTPKTTKK